MKVSILRLILILAPAFFAGVKADADQTDICGIGIEVDQISAIDEKNVKLTLFGDTQIVSEESVPERVINAYALKYDSAQIQSAEKWKSLLDSCLKEKKYNLASAAFVLYAYNSLKNNSLNTDYISQVLLTESSEEFSKSITQEKAFFALNKAVKNLVFLALATKNVHWLRANLLGREFTLSEEFKSFSESKIIESLRVKDITLAKKITNALETLYVADSEKYKKYDLACGLISEIISNGSEVSNTKLMTLVSLRNTDSSLRPVLDPFIIESFHSLAESAAQRGKFEEALSLISGISPDQVTPTTYDILQRILVSIDPASRIFLNQSVIRLLESAIHSNQTLKNQLTLFYYSRTIKLIEQYDLNNAVKSFEIYKSLSDNSPELKKLQFEIALKYSQTGNREEAKKYLSNISPNLKDKIRLFFDGYYGNPLLYTLLILIPLLIKLIYEFLKKPLYQSTNRTEEKYVPSDEPEEGVRQEGPGFVSARSSKQKNHLFEEYLTCLKLFELDKNSDLKTIKTAYRNAVRKIHPDLNSSNQSPDDASRFVELTKAYDRLRELHRLLGLGDK